MECDLFYNGHNPKLYGTVGGKINDKFVFCGGSKGFGNNYQDKCYFLGDSEPVQNLTMMYGSHTVNGGVILPNNTIFIAGKLPNLFLK